jgi:hypothetical protein
MSGWVEARVAVFYWQRLAELRDWGDLVSRRRASRSERRDVVKRGKSCTAERHRGIILSCIACSVV